MIWTVDYKYKLRTCSARSYTVRIIAKYFTALYVVFNGAAIARINTYSACLCYLANFNSNNSHTHEKNTISFQCKMIHLTQAVSRMKNFRPINTAKINEITKKNCKIRFKPQQRGSNINISDDVEEYQPFYVVN